MPSLPLPQSLPKECRKAEKILKSFMETSRGGLDGVIPRDVLARAKGFCIFTVVKAGFLFSARAGSGIVIARLPDGSWSAPSAIGTAGMGFGGQAGAEMTEFLIVLNSQSALKSFMSAGSLTLGGNLSVAVGPLGRNGEVTGSLNTKGKLAAMYSYSKTKGLFGGISIEGSVIVERQDANCIAYEDDSITAKKLLMGAVEPPAFASGLIEILKRSTGDLEGWVQDTELPRTSDDYAFGDVASVSSSPTTRPKLKTRSTSGSFFGGSADSLKKAMSKPLVGPKKKNPADSYLDASRKSWDGGMAGNGGEEDGDRDGGYGSTSNGNTSTFRPSSAGPLSYNNNGNTTSASGPSNTLFSNTFSQMENENTSYGPSRVRSTSSASSKFATHFDSDFDPSSSPGTQTHQRQSSSISSFGGVGTGSGSGRPSIEYHTSHTPNWNSGATSGDPNANNDDPFGLFAEDPKPAPLPPNLAYNLSLARQSAQRHHAQPSQSSRSFYERQTPPLTTGTSSSFHSTSPTSPMFSSSHQRNGSGGSYTPGTGMASPTPVGSLSVKRGLNTPIEPGAVRAIALFDFEAQQAGDLKFQKGDVIIVTKRSESVDDWWTGRIETPTRREGIFPANFVELYSADL